MRGDSPTELVAFRVHYPSKFESDSRPHYQFGTKHVTILKGALYIGFGDHTDSAAAKPYGPGSFIVIPAGTAHFEWMRGEVDLHVEAIGPMRTAWLGQ